MSKTKDPRREMDAISQNIVRSRKGLRAREAILDAAFRLIAKGGLGTLNVSRITSEAGIGRASFYNYFDHVDDVALELFRRTQMQMEEMLESIHQQHERGAKRLQLCLDEIQTRLSSDINFQKVCSELMSVSEAARAEFSDAVRPELEAMVESGTSHLQNDEIDAFLDLIRTALFAPNSSPSSRKGKVELLLRLCGASRLVDG